MCDQLLDLVGRRFDIWFHFAVRIVERTANGLHKIHRIHAGRLAVMRRVEQQDFVLERRRACHRRGYTLQCETGDNTRPERAAA